MNYNLACDSHAIIRPSSSSLIQAQSWSCGVGGSAEIEQPQSVVGSAQRLSVISRNNTNRISLASSNASELENQGSNQHQQSAVTDDQSVGSELKQHADAPIADVNNTLLHHAPVPRLSLHIPTVYLTRKDPSSSSYHVYQLTISSSAGDEWSVYRRYSQFHALHHQLKAKEPAIAKLHFPPKRRLNSKASTIVQERRLKLEEYIRCLNTFIEKQPGCSPADCSVTSIGTSSSESSWASVTAALAAAAAATTSSSAGRTANSPTERSSQSESACSSTEPTRSGCADESGGNSSSRLPQPAIASGQVETPLEAAIAGSSSSSCNNSTATNSVASTSARNSLSQQSGTNPTTTTVMMTTPSTMTVPTMTRIQDSCFIEQASIRSLFHNFISLNEKQSEQFEEANIS